jgi:hypothetical protein
MVTLMSRRPFRTLIYVLIAAQALSLAPATAFGSDQAGENPEMACADMMPAAAESEPCPCCPEGAMGAAACLSACTAAAGAISTFILPIIKSDSELALGATFLPRAKISDPPLKPPPIA